MEWRMGAIDESTFYLLYREGHRYSKAAVHRVDLQDASVEQGELALGVSMKTAAPS
jgi:hypothetical protein